MVQWLKQWVCAQNNYIDCSVFTEHRSGSMLLEYLIQNTQAEEILRKNIETSKDYFVVTTITL